MIEIKPSIITDEIKGKAKDIKFDENTFAMTAIEGGELVGIGIMKLYKSYAVIEKIDFYEEYKIIGYDYLMGKAMLNFIERRSIYDTYSDSSVDEGLLKKLRFIKNEDKKERKFDYFLNLKGYFDVNCHH